MESKQVNKDSIKSYVGDIISGSGNFKNMDEHLDGNIVNYELKREDL